jgi:hypothetical protein
MAGKIGPPPPIEISGKSPITPNQNDRLWETKLELRWKINLGRLIIQTQISKKVVSPQSGVRRYISKFWEPNKTRSDLLETNYTW